MTVLSLLFPLLAFSANTAVNDACKRLCETDSECVRKCVSHAELFELRADIIHAFTDFTPLVENRLKALRTGANLEAVEICKKSGWSLDNQMTCLRAYPTPEVMKNCKKLSPLQEEQVRCVRNGKTEADVEACNLLSPDVVSRLQCLEMNITAADATSCRMEGGNTHARMQCLLRLERAKKDGALNSRIQEARAQERERRTGRAPASANDSD